MSTKYSTAEERKTSKRQIDNMKDVLSNPIAWNEIRDKESFKRQLKQEEGRLKQITPPKLDPVQKRTYAQRIEQLERVMRLGNSSKGIPSMPSQKEQWDTPAGAVGKHGTWENFWKTHSVDENENIVKVENGYGAIFQWKDARRAFFVDREEEDPDVANTDVFRPNDPEVGASKFIDYQSMTMSPLAKLSYEEVEEIFPDREPSTGELKIRAAEVEQHREKMAQELRCQAKNSNGTQCKRDRLPHKLHCEVKTHKNQFKEK
jgi:hypothetical protein